MLTFSTQGVAAPAAGQVTLRIRGDGTTDTVSMDLRVAPYNVEFNGNFPTSIDFAFGTSPNGTVSLSPKATLTVVFSTAPASDSDNIITVNLNYA